MTRLLVSVRSAAEAKVALAAGADVIDVKEPRRGSLGAATQMVWRDVIAAVGQERPLSAALGELLEFVPPELNELHGFAYAKLGLAGCAALPDWRQRWCSALDALPAGMASVAVAYADYESARSPHPSDVCTEGHRLGCRALLVDTAHKHGGDVFDVLGLARLEQLFEQARELHLKTVLAGSLRLDRLAEAIGLRPDYVAVRGAVCLGAREGELDAHRVREWVDALQTRAANIRLASIARG